MNPIIKELLHNGFSLRIEYDKTEDRMEYMVEGFYKSGTVSLYESNEILYARARYDTVTEVNDFRDLVILNHHWWINTKHKYDGWASPDSQWLPFLLKYKLVEQHVNTVTTYS